VERDQKARRGPCVRVRIERFLDRSKITGMPEQIDLEAADVDQTRTLRLQSLNLRGGFGERSIEDACLVGGDCPWPWRIIRAMATFDAPDRTKQALGQPECLLRVVRRLLAGLGIGVCRRMHGK
jgi:hypothetical protein